MIRIKTPEEIEKIRESGRILAGALAAIKPEVAPGVTTKALDQVAYDFIVRAGGAPAFLDYMGYPASLCVSVNHQVIHGIPGKRKLKEGDLVSLDLGVELDGLYSDAAVTWIVGAATPERQKLARVTEECLYRGIEAARAGARLNDVSKAVYDHATANGFSVVRQFCGHGVGFELHEDPQIRNYVGVGPNPRLRPGMVLAIEPMINAGTWEVRILDDDWTVETIDGRDSAHFEHTVAILEDRTEILTALA